MYIYTYYMDGVYILNGIVCIKRIKNKGTDGGLNIHTRQRNVWRTRCARKPHYTKISYFVVNLLIGHHGYQQGHHTATPRRRYISARCRRDPPFVYKIRTVEVDTCKRPYNSKYIFAAMSCAVYKVYLLCGTTGIVIIVSVISSEEDGMYRSSMIFVIFIYKSKKHQSCRLTFGYAIRNWYINFSECVSISYYIF